MQLCHFPIDVDRLKSLLHSITSNSPHQKNAQTACLATATLSYPFPTLQSPRVTPSAPSGVLSRRVTILVRSPARWVPTASSALCQVTAQVPRKSRFVPARSLSRDSSRPTPRAMVAVPSRPVPVRPSSVPPGPLLQPGRRRPPPAARCPSCDGRLCRAPGAASSSRCMPN